MMLGGALAAFSVGAATGSVLAGCAAGIAAGLALAALFAYFVLRRGADPIVAGTALNVLALGLTGVVFRSLNPAGSALSRAPQMGEVAPALNLYLLVAIALVAGVAFYLGRTRSGLALRAVGERAEAAHAQGVNVLRIRLGAVLFGGACAGLAGSVNYNLPMNAEDYVHRIGRTGRAGALGTSVSFACEEDAPQIPVIEEFIGRKLTAVYPEDSWLRPLPAPKAEAGRGAPSHGAPQRRRGRPRSGGGARRQHRS